MRVASALLAGLSLLAAPLAVTATPSSSLVSSSSSYEAEFATPMVSDSSFRRRHHRSLNQRLNHLEAEIEKVKDLLSQFDANEFSQDDVDAEANEASYQDAVTTHTHQVSSTGNSCVHPDALKAAVIKARDQIMASIKAEAAKHQQHHTTEVAGADEADEEDGRVGEAVGNAAGNVVRGVALVGIGAIALPLGAIYVATSTALCTVLFPFIAGMSPTGHLSYRETCLRWGL